MSNQHAKRLSLVRLEQEAAREALEQTSTHALSNPSFYQADIEDLQRASRNAEKTYYFRLVAELEGMLYRHLKDYHPNFTFDEKSDGAAHLVNHCRNQLDPRKGDRLPNDSADDVIKAIRWRNYLVHGERSSRPARVTSIEAYQYIHDLVLLLPQMKGDHA